MRPNRTERRLESALTETRQLLEQWDFALLESGRFVVRPTGHDLHVEPLRGLVAALHRGNLGRGLTQLVFDLRGVQRIGRNWTVAVALLIGFARTAGIPVSVVAPNGHAAAVLNLYRRNAELRSLLKPAVATDAA